MKTEAKGKVVLFAALGLSVFAFAMSIGGNAHATETWIGKVKKGKVGKTLADALRSLSSEVIALAKKWAETRSVPVSEILATILLESRGNPSAHLLNAKEDSRGLMQVNVRAHGSLLQERGYKPDDLFKPSVAIEIGSLIYANARAKVSSLVAKCKAPQTYDVGTLTRLYYAGPKYVVSMLQRAKVQADTSHPFKNSETYVDHWRQATQAVKEVFGSTYA